MPGFLCVCQAAERGLVDSSVAGQGSDLSEELVVARAAADCGMLYRAAGGFARVGSKRTGSGEDRFTYASVLTRLKRNAEAGMVMVNLPTAGVDYHVPFGGRKASSYGPREQGRYAAEFFTTVKTAWDAVSVPAQPGDPTC